MLHFLDRALPVAEINADVQKVLANTTPRLSATKTHLITGLFSIRSETMQRSKADLF